MTTNFTPPKGTKNYTKLSGELWKQAKGYSSNYFVSNLGRILTLTHHGGVSPAIMKPAMTIQKAKRNRPYKILKTVMDGRSILVHRVVALTWVPNPKNHPQVDHVNGNTLDNRAENLEWVTGSENQIRSFKTGLRERKVGELNHKSRLTDRQVCEIREEWDTTHKRSRRQLALEYGVSEACIKDVLESRTYRHLPPSKYKYNNRKKLIRFPSGMGTISSAKAT